MSRNPLPCRLKEQRLLRGLLTPRVRGAPEDNGPVLVLGRGQHVVEVEGEAVQVADVQRAEVVVEGVVEEAVVDGEVEGLLGPPRLPAAPRGRARRRGRVGVGEEGVGRRGLGVGGEVEAVCGLVSGLCLGTCGGHRGRPLGGGSRDVPGMYSTICPIFVLLTVGAIVTMGEGRGTGCVMLESVVQSRRKSTMPFKEPGPVGCFAWRGPSDGRWDEDNDAVGMGDIT